MSIKRRLEALEKSAQARRPATPTGPKTLDDLREVLTSAVDALRVVEAPGGGYKATDPHDYTGRALASLLSALKVVYGGDHAEP